MILPRFLLRLHSALLPLLMFVVMAAGADVRPPIGALGATVEVAAAEAPAVHTRAASVPRQIIAATTDLDVDDETDLRVASVVRVWLTPWQRLPIVSSIPRDHPTPPRHRACAAPPTGPPHV